MQAPANRGGSTSRSGSYNRLALTQREAEVVGLIALGLQNKEIGERLGVSPATIKAHVRACLLKCGVATRAALATWYAMATRDAGGYGRGS